MPYILPIEYTVIKIFEFPPNKARIVSANENILFNFLNILRPIV